MSQANIIEPARSRAIDTAYLATQTWDDIDLQVELLMLFVGQAERIEALLKSGPDGESAAAALHTLKGSARAIGAWALGEAVERMEQHYASSGSFRAQAEWDALRHTIACACSDAADIIVARHGPTLAKRHENS